MPNYYRLDNHTPVSCDLDDWAQRIDRRTADADPWRVERTDLGDGVTVSTVFLGLDHQWQLGGPPLLFETMVFGLSDGEEPQWRCSTWDQAVTQHAEAIAWVAAYREGGE